MQGQKICTCYTDKFLREETPKVDEDPEAEEGRGDDPREGGRGPERSSLAVPCRGRLGSNALPGQHPPHVAMPERCTSEPEERTGGRRAKDNSAHVQKV